MTYLSWLRFTIDLGLFFLLSALALSFMEAVGDACRGYAVGGMCRGVRAGGMCRGYVQGVCSGGYVQGVCSGGEI